MWPANGGVDHAPKSASLASRGAWLRPAKAGLGRGEVFREGVVKPLVGGTVCWGEV